METGYDPVDGPMWLPVIGELVWAKVRSHPWWPARVFDPALASQKANRARRPGHLLIAFFGDETYNWMKPLDLLPFSKHFTDKEHQTSQKLFCTAVSDALDYLDENTTNGVQVASGEDTSTATSNDLLKYVRLSARSPLDWGPDVVKASQMRCQLLAIRAGFAISAGVGNLSSLWSLSKDVPESTEMIPKSADAGHKSQKLSKSKERKERKKKDASDVSSKKKTKASEHRKLDEAVKLKSKKLVQESLHGAGTLEDEVDANSAGNITAKDSVYEWTDEIENDAIVELGGSAKRKRTTEVGDKHLQMVQSKKQKSGLEEGAKAEKGSKQARDLDYAPAENRVSFEDEQTLEKGERDMMGLGVEVIGIVRERVRDGNEIRTTDANVSPETHRKQDNTFEANDAGLKPTEDPALTSSGASEGDYDDKPLANLVTPSHRVKGSEGEPAEKKRPSRRTLKCSPSKPAKRKASPKALKISDRLPKTSLGDLEEPKPKRSKSAKVGSKNMEKLGSPSEVTEAAEESDVFHVQTSKEKVVPKHVPGKLSEKKQKDRTEDENHGSQKLPASVVFGGRAELRTKALHDSIQGQQNVERKEEAQLGEKVAEQTSVVEAGFQEFQGSVAVENYLKLVVSASVEANGGAGEDIGRCYVPEEAREKEKTHSEVAMKRPSDADTNVLKILHKRLLDLARDPASSKLDDKETVAMQAKLLQFRQAVYSKAGSTMPGVTVQNTPETQQAQLVKPVSEGDDIFSEQLEEGVNGKRSGKERKNKVDRDSEGKREQGDADPSKEFGLLSRVYNDNEDKKEWEVSDTKDTETEEDEDDYPNRKDIKGSGKQASGDAKDKLKVGNKQRRKSKTLVRNGDFPVMQVEAANGRTGSVSFKEKRKQSESTAAGKSRREHREVPLNLPRTVLKDKEHGRIGKLQEAILDVDQELKTHKSGHQEGQSPGTPPPRFAPRIPTPDLRLLQMKFAEKIPMPSEVELRAKFGRFGTIEALRVNRSTRFALITFKYQRDAESALTEAKGLMFRTVKVHMRLLEPQKYLHGENRRSSQPERERVREEDNEHELAETSIMPVIPRTSGSRLGSSSWPAHRSDDPNWKGPGIAGPVGTSGRPGPWGAPCPIVPQPVLSHQSHGATVSPPAMTYVRKGILQSAFKETVEIANQSLPEQSPGHMYWAAPQTTSHVDSSRPISDMASMSNPSPAGAFPVSSFPACQSSIQPTVVAQPSHIPPVQTQYSSPPLALANTPLGNLLGGLARTSTGSPQAAQPEVEDTLMNLLKQVSVLVGQAQSGGVPSVQQGP